ncbi:unnamed protein product [Triticum turgidum subsp. durum]|uniref:DUF4220 domain-containing protein n=1 Tax=Triticum turgidum subsp. durum TaxID=4567 RepID=A0A9R1R070_TRITD|nr:unnamed protein product [Triticum turgidum subsp. durum]
MEQPIGNPSELWKSPRGTVIRIEVLALVAIALSFFFVAFGSSCRWSNRWIIQKGVLAANALSLSLRTYSIGLMQSSPVKSEMYPIWAVSLLTLFGSINSVNGYNLDHNNQLLKLLYQLCLYCGYVLLIGISTISSDVVTVIPGTWTTHISGGTVVVTTTPYDLVITLVILASIALLQVMQLPLVSRLGRQPILGPPLTSIVKGLAEFWANRLRISAPSDNVKEHIDRLSRGGEFITHIWAMLYATGIVKQTQMELPDYGPLRHLDFLNLCSLGRDDAAQSTSCALDNMGCDYSTPGPPFGMSGDLYRNNEQK